MKSIKKLENLEKEIYSFLNLKNKKDNIQNAKFILSYYCGVDWSQYADFSGNTYNRVLVSSNDIFDIYILSWKKEYKTPVHDHASYGCILKVVQGEIYQSIYQKTSQKLEKIIDNEVLSCGSISYMDDTIGYHLVGNNSKKDAVSIHIYSPPNHQTNYLSVE